MLLAVLLGFAGALAAPLVHRAARRFTGWVMALLPLGLLAYLASLLPRVVRGETVTASAAWVPSLGVQISLYVDGLSLLFAMLITGIGALVMIYAGGYLKGHPLLGRFYLYITLFMASMLGLVTSGNLLALFIFWELTSISSYLLIGWKHEEEKARKAALMALLVTGGGGLALLAGLVLVGIAAGSFELAAVLAGGSLAGHALYAPALALVLLGAFTKSAQFPFHFWLPEAMAAPAPVSTYLHSATMVKAGVFLLARLFPVLGGTPVWTAALVAVGGVTMVIGAALAVQQTDLKRVLAYTTVAALGALVLLIGIGTPGALKAAMLYLLGHALYKAAMFMAAGSVDHETGVRDLPLLGGLRRAMPLTAAATVVAGLSNAGIPPLVGFLAKEYIYDATLGGPLPLLITAAAFAANVLVAVAAGMVAYYPFFGRPVETPQHPHEAPPSMLIGPLLLAALGLAAGLLPAVVSGYVLTPAVSAITGAAGQAVVKYPTTLTTVLALSIATIALSLVGVAAYRRVARGLALANPGEAFGPARLYRAALDGLLWLADRLTALIQSGYLRVYLGVVIVTFGVVVGGTLLARVPAGSLFEGWQDIRFHEALLLGLMLGGLVMAVLSRSRLAAVVGLSVVGYSTAMIFVLFSAPDLAMTQFAIETLTVILFVLVIYRLPRFSDLTTRLEKARDALIALAAGAIMTVLALVVIAEPGASRLAGYFIENSLPLAKGRNIVNVILVDFRGMDTLGEITVLAAAAIGVYALMRLRPREHPDEDQTAQAAERPQVEEEQAVVQEVGQ